MYSKFTLFIAALLCLAASAYAGGETYWQPVHPDLVRSQGKRYLVPSRYQTYVLNTAALKVRLAALPEDPHHAALLEFPLPDGRTRTFRIWQTPMMEPALAAKYPEIKTFTAEATDDRRVSAKIDISPAGFHAMIFDGEQTFMIDPYSDTEDGNYICYYRKDCQMLSAHHCAVENTGETQPEQGHTAQRVNGATRKTYRLALACTGEYAGAVGGTTPTKASVLAQMVLIMNRVNGVYERDFAVHMTLIANTDTLIFLDGNTDPYTDGDPNSLLTQNQSTVTSRIGSANYDIGHVFSTAGGGLAGLGVVCNNSFKAQGETGMDVPLGDPFAIDYVAHEMGHQFGGNHTFNSSQGACSGNGVSSVAFEPGSGTTIMAYAGICSSDDLAAHSDAYFHTASLREISNYITTGNGNTCPVTAASTNVPATYPDFTASYTIPVFTPFELTAPNATDATADTLTYCWEEWDLGNFGQSWNGTGTAMPYFRSFTGTASPTRVFPSVNKILAGTYVTIGERLPTAARTLKFIMTERDIYQGWGTYNSSYDTDTVTVNVAANTDTFRVTSQASSVTWNTGSAQTVTWNVAGTTAAPFNTANVNIYLSVDSGKTFPYQLASNVPNNGSATITVPGAISQPSNKARVKVKGAGNVFFQLNRANININVVPLPVTLQSFGAALQNCSVMLHWTTGDARNFSHFELQRSSDDHRFETIALIGAGADHDYRYTDALLKDGRYYYRLKMTDADGQFEYSTVITVNRSCKGQDNLVVYPNPARDKVTLSGSTRDGMVAVYAADGRLVKQQKAAAGQPVILDVRDLAAGLYMLQLNHDDGTATQIKIVKE